ncbi:30S ribosomal protein S5 [Patescibacteria group bacterium]|nr:30S ribosomal protein S5 [Patescibacteria group bacterium]MBU1500552.1 30S ribosomal protein S5 [Patescibacteria group bacterium]MBU2080441.1 30S ribosomal protein S5 [Patescibacteria group bacterium]MBU2123754.1 30S ribosomal protein S5 [Patescibacteria group bacterium]MBU2194610.1 30S ribosomal protein S5 [Patescibacteria group bacterium]
MTDTPTPTMDTEKKAPETTPETATTAAPTRDDRRGGGRRPGGRDSRGRGPRAPRERSEFEQATIEVRRVARVMAGGRRFSFSVTVVIGDKKGRVGVGLGKGADTALAIDKAVRDAKKHLITVARTADGSIAHDVSVKNSSSIVTIVPSPGRGIVAGSAMRVVLEHAGVTNVVAKILTRTKNKLTIARATVDALASAGAR